jgi:hypothetical protein
MLNKVYCLWSGFNKIDGRILGATFICELSNSAAGSSYYVVSSYHSISESRVVRVVEGSGLSIICGTIPVFIYRN